MNPQVTAILTLKAPAEAPGLKAEKSQKARANPVSRHSIPASCYPVQQEATELSLLKETHRKKLWLKFPTYILVPIWC